MDAQHLYRIVLIDDSRMARLGLREQLNRTAEFRLVGEAGLMAEGLALVEKLTPDLVLLDISLPDGSGCTHAGGCWENPDTRVLILSVYDDPTVIREANRSRRSKGYVLKDTPVAMWRRRCDGWPVAGRRWGRSCSVPS